MQHIQQVSAHSAAAPSTRLLTRIMSLDDEVVDQLVCKRVIKRSGLAQEVVSITTPAAALSHLADSQNPEIDLILLDVNMPGMNGFEFLQAAEDQLLAGQELPPVLVMLSAPLGPLHRKLAQKFDLIKGYLEKPLEDAPLESAIRDIQQGRKVALRPVVS